MQSPITHVAVYRRGALVTRTLEVDCSEQVPPEVRFGALPLALDDGSLRVRLENAGSVLALDLRLELELVRDPVPAELLDDGPLLRERGRLQSRQALWRSLMSELYQLEPPFRPSAPSGEPPPPYPLEPRRELVRLRQERVEKFLKRLSEVELRLGDIELELAENARRRETAQAPPSALDVRKAVVVGLRGGPSAGAPVRVHLSYAVEGALWAPSYTVRFDRDLSLAEVTLRANLAQSSGEDWTQVGLSVSTANRSQWRELPELSSRRLGKAQPKPPRQGWRPPPLGAEELYGDYQPRVAAPPRPPDPPTMTLHPRDMAIALMSMPPESAAQVFKELGPARVQEISLEISRLPQMSMAARANSVAEFRRWHPEWAHYFEEPRLSLMQEMDSDLIAPMGGSAGNAGNASRSGTQVGAAFAAPSDAFVALPPPPPAVAATAPSMSLERRAKSKDSIMVDLLPGPSRARRVAPPPPEPSSWRHEPEPTAEGMEVGREHLEYRLLRMPGPDEPGRGKLQTQTALEACRRLWQARYPELPLPDLDGALREAQRVLVGGLPTMALEPGVVGGFDYLYPGEAPVDLESDARYRSLPVLTRQLTAQPVLVCVPSLSTEVFRQIELESLPDLALPPGLADVFVGRDYFLSAPLPALLPGATNRLSLGVEQGVKVVRNTSFKESTAGMMGGTLQLRHTVEVEVANRLTREVRLEIRERLPEPAEDEVKVRLETSDPPLETIEHEGQRWQLRLGAGEKRTLKYAYVIELPSKLELSGGNRREA